MFLCLSVTAIAQDIIVKRDGMTIKAKIERVTDTVVEYKKYQDTSGSILTISKKDLLAINYEDGISVTYNETGDAKTTNNSLQNNGERMVTDAQLLALSRGKSFKVLDPEEKGRRLKITGWTVGGSLIAAGITTIILGFNDALGFDKARYHGNIGWRYQHYDEACACPKAGMSIGIPTMIVGAGAGAFLIHKGQKMIDQAKIQSATLLQYEMPMGDCTTLSANVNLMADGQTHQYLPGIGFNITF